LRTAEVDRWLGGLAWHPITKNNIRKIFTTGHHAVRKNTATVGRHTRSDLTHAN
jgi:hypothetical protein